MFKPRLSGPLTNRNFFSTTGAISSMAGRFRPDLFSMQDILSQSSGQKGGYLPFKQMSKAHYLHIPRSRHLYSSRVITMRGKGFFDSISKIWNWIKPGIKKATEIITPLIPKIKEVLPQAMNLGKDIVSSIRDGKTENITTLLDRSKDLFNKGKDIATDVVGGVRSVSEILKKNNNLRKQRAEETQAQLVNDSNAKALNNIRERAMAERQVVGQKISASNPNLEQVGSDSGVTPAVGSGFVTKLLKKNAKRFMKGRGIKFI